MSDSIFDRDAMARWYAQRHLKTDTGIRSVYYLPKQASEREIRFLEVNDLIVERGKNPLEPIDFGVDIGSETAHSLFVLDVTPSQWDRIRTNALHLPPGWTLDGATVFARQSHE